jgi:D-alanyl-D-alanine carboxypeptidase
MRSRRAGLVAVVGVLLGLVTLGLAPAAAHASPATAAAPAALAAPAAQAPPLPKNYVLVDFDTGAVIAQQDARTPRPPASTIKLLTGFIATQRIAPGTGIPISSLAESMPARKINVKSGQVWSYEGLMHSMLIVSANDAAVALAEKVGDGSLDNYVSIANMTADRLGLADHPVLNDPAGLDDEFANKGGSLISARDLAIVARAAMTKSEIMTIVNLREYNFVGGDGASHHLPNHNLFLDLYPGANGLKTGTTDRAGRTFVGSATRNGRTMLAVVFDAPDVYASAGALLDQGFATPVAAEAGLDHLPAIVPDAALPPPPTTEVSTPLVTANSAAKTGSIFDSTAFALLLLIVGLLPLVALRRRVMAKNGVLPPRRPRPVVQRRPPRRMIDLRDDHDPAYTDEFDYEEFLDLEDGVRLVDSDW